MTRLFPPVMFLTALLSLGVLHPTLRAEPATAPATHPAAPRPPGVKMVPNLEYANVNGKSLLLDLYLPERIETPVPVVMYVHGGGWSSGDKRDRLATPLAKYGFAVASIDYRLVPEATYPAQIQDCKAAVRWLRAHAKFYGLDGAHIGVWGTSAGGHLVALLGTSGDVKELEGDEGNLDQSSRVQAVCDWFGPTDFLQFARQAAEAHIARRPDANAPTSALSRLLGGPVQENKDKAASANPITFISKDDPPFLIMHGGKDPLVPVAQSQILRDALEKAGVSVTLIVIPAAGHGFGGVDNFNRVLEFFNKTLKIQTAPAATQPAGAN